MSGWCEGQPKEQRSVTNNVTQTHIPTNTHHTHRSRRFSSQRLDSVATRRLIDKVDLHCWRKSIKPVSRENAQVQSYAHTFHFPTINARHTHTHMPLTSHTHPTPAVMRQIYRYTQLVGIYRAQGCKIYHATDLWSAMDLCQGLADICEGDDP